MWWPLCGPDVVVECFWHAVLFIAIFYALLRRYLPWPFFADDKSASGTGVGPLGT